MTEGMLCSLLSMNSIDGSSLILDLNDSYASECDECNESERGVGVVEQQNVNVNVRWMRSMGPRPPEYGDIVVVNSVVT